MTNEMQAMIDAVGSASADIFLFKRYNNFTDDHVDGLPVEICRYGGTGEPEIVVVRRFMHKEAVDEDVLGEVVREYQARAAIRALLVHWRDHTLPYNVRRAMDDAMDEEECSRDRIFAAGIEALLKELDRTYPNPAEKVTA